MQGQNLNMANRECCDLDVRDYKTNKPWIFADFCNTTTAGFSGDSVHAMRKGQKSITFHNPIEGTMTCEFQCHPFRIYALLSDGEILTSAVIANKETITCTEEGKLTLPTDAMAGTVFVYTEDGFGLTESEIQGTFATNTFTATNADDIVIGNSYEVGYLINKLTGVQRIAFNNKKIPKYFRIEQQTLDKDENGDLIPKRIIAYKATPKRNLELNFSSEGEPASVKIEFDVLADKDDNVLDMVEMTE